MVNDMQQDDKLAEAVIQLHNIARMIESEIGRGLLSDDVRDCANRLHMITRPIKPAQEQSK
jgi:hypothetical protein